jgi:hypothetical protein
VQTREERLASKKKYREENGVLIAKKAKGYRKLYKTTHKGRAATLLGSCRRRAKLSKSTMTLTKEWVMEKLEKGVCEITNAPFSYTKRKEHTRSPFAPSIDRIDSRNPNYTPDNCRLVLWAVNNTFAEYGEEIMLPILRAIVDAKKNEPPSLSERDYIALEMYSELGTVPRTGFGKNNDSVDDSTRVKISRDLGDRPIKSRTISMDSGMSEVGALEPIEGRKNNGKFIAEIDRLEGKR